MLVVEILLWDVQKVFLKLTKMDLLAMLRQFVRRCP